MSGLDLRRPIRIAFVGWGAIARRAADLLAARSPNIVLSAIATRTLPEGAPRLPNGISWLPGPDALEQLDIDLLVEAAGREAVEPWGHVALKRGMSYAVCSTSAFCYDAVLQRLMASAETGGGRILVPPGALAGIDALAAASILPLDSVDHRIVKPPLAWKGTAAEGLVRLEELQEACTFFEGTAREAARRFPANANVAAITALAGLGLDRTRVALVADPAVRRNRHQLRVQGDFGVMEMTIENRPLEGNPRSSELTALAVVRLIENQSKIVAL